ncbi:MAG: cytochrome [Rhodospirillales bacterium]|jgi:cytochrome c553|nr:cytochrome [Rhodospirillales bacterium]
MRTFVAAVAAVLLLAVLGGIVLVYSGAYDVAANNPHWAVTRWVMETARMRSIKAHAAGIAAPPGLGDQMRIVMGTDHFAAHCAVCHGAPGVPKDDIAEGLYPQPPDLALTAKLYSDAELFWILKHGIKMTGMPSWSDHSDDELWATVAFLRKLDGMSEQDYGRLVQASMQMGGHHHHDESEPAADGHAGEHGEAAPAARDAHQP